MWIGMEPYWDQLEFKSFHIAIPPHPAHDLTTTAVTAPSGTERDWLAAAEPRGGLKEPADDGPALPATMTIAPAVATNRESLGYRRRVIW